MLWGALAHAWAPAPTPKGEMDQGGAPATTLVFPEGVGTGKGVPNGCWHKRPAPKGLVPTRPRFAGGATRPLVFQEFKGGAQSAKLLAPSGAKKQHQDEGPVRCAGASRA